MKKFIALLALVALILAAIPAYAREEQPAEEAWYELDEESRVLTVRLPADTSTGYEWNFDISDPAALELLTMEYTGDEADEQMAGAGGQWVASFYSTLEGTGEADLTLTYQRAGEGDIAGQRLIRVSIGENDLLQVLAAETVVPAEEAWYELDEESRVLTVRLPANPTTGYEWNFDISDPAALELLTMEYTGDEADEQMVGVGGQWVASFYSTLEGTGEADLTLTYQRAGEGDIAEQRLIQVSIGENDLLQVLSAETVDLGA